LTTKPVRGTVRRWGSRAKGTQRPGSDIDLVLWGDLDILRVARIGGELDELPLPYIFDVRAYDAIHHPELKAHVDRVGRVVYDLEAKPVGETCGPAGAPKVGSWKG
jgi:predicted nucleotidyltransferase